MKQKYPRTYHLPWSEGVSDDDKIGSDQHLIGKNVVVTEKMDGECTAIYPNGQYHARSIDNTSQPWQAPMINEVLQYLYNEDGCILKDNQRLYGENMYAKHSIDYSTLDAWFYAFSLWEDDYCLSFDELESLGVVTPKVLYRGIYDRQKLIELATSIETSISEGYVVRLDDGFHKDDFSKYVMKFVRQNHVQTDIHWTKSWVPNKKRFT